MFSNPIPIEPQAFAVVDLNRGSGNPLYHHWFEFGVTTPNVSLNLSRIFGYPVLCKGVVQNYSQRQAVENAIKFFNESRKPFNYEFLEDIIFEAGF